ncbi:hypothetical protein Tco_1276174 [Tanacetum coccineum]
MEEGESAPNIPNLNHFKAAREGQITLEEAKLQIQEVKRPEEELVVIEAKRVKMMDEYNHCINFRDNLLPITKFSYRVNNVSKEATIRITRNNQPLNLKIYDRFLLKMLGFIRKLGIPPPLQLTAFELPTAEKKKEKKK